MHRAVSPIQVRVYAEDPARDFRPSSGLLTEVRLPDTLRVDTWIDSGSDVPPFYDPMLAKLIAHAPTRAAAIEQLDAALGRDATLRHRNQSGIPARRSCASPASGAPNTPPDS